MPIEHNLITDPQIHEPKGITSATAGSVYVSGGAGSGTWKKVDSAGLKGLSGDGGSANKIIVSDGSNGFTLKEGFAHGSMVLTGNTNAFTTTTATDGTLSTASDYSLFTGTGAPLAAGPNMLGVAFSTNQLTAPVAGVYELRITGQISGFPTTTAKVGCKYRVNGAAYSVRKSLAKGFNSGDIGQFNLSELVTFAANDYVQMYVASSAAGGLTISDLTFSLVLIKAS